MSIARDDNQTSIKPNALGIASALIAWFGAQLAAVGVFDRLFVDSDTGGTFIYVGAAICMAGTFVLGMQKLKRPVGAVKLWLLCVGLMPITMFILFIGWRIALSTENIEKCENGDAVACRTVAEIRAKRGKSDDAIRLYERGCELQDARSCRALGGQANKEPDKVSESALSYYLKACELSDGLGCDRAANMLRQEDPERAQELFERACGLEYVSACSSLR